jgi:hypothetical protein
VEFERCSLVVHASRLHAGWVHCADDYHPTQRVPPNSASRSAVDLTPPQLVRSSSLAKEVHSGCTIADLYRIFLSGRTNIADGS